MNMNPIMKKKNLKNVVFDLGGVLLQWNVNLMLDESSPCHKFKAQLTTLLKSEIWTDFDRGKINYDEVITSGSSFDVPKEMMIKFIDHMCDHLAPKNSTLEVVKKLKSQGTNLYVLSNMNSYVGDILLQRHSFWPDFNRVFFSCDTGFAKPEIGIYQFLLKEICLNATEILFIDDNEPNIIAANKLGFQTILFKNAELLSQELFG